MEMKSEDELARIFDSDPLPPDTIAFLERLQRTIP